MLIKLLLTDLDGCLTDGTYYVFENSDDILKRFHTRDFHGMALLAEQGIGVGCVTRAESCIPIKQFARIIPSAVVHTGVKNKRSLVEQFYVKERSLDWSNIAYIGDDEMDIELLKYVGLPACPKDAHESVIHAVNSLDDGIILSRNGGCGCVREICDVVLLAARYEAAV